LYPNVETPRRSPKAEMFLKVMIEKEMMIDEKDNWNNA